MNTIQTPTSRELSDAELASFHGGECTIRYNYDAQGRLSTITVEGDCQNVNINVSAK
ncbi:hypothetical protein [Glutamicibacter endophyticus]|uniref:hypothetical protein n=1 Tax=Glutamicibacter endophyticus TaxID=1522174 RepID=UPI003AF188F6